MFPMQNVQVRNVCQPDSVVHPGNMVSSHLTRNSWLHKIACTLVRPFAKSLQQAAAPGVFAATSPQLKGGIYINNCFPCQPSQIALDPLAGDNLVQASLKILHDRGFEI